MESLEDEYLSQIELKGVPTHLQKAPKFQQLLLTLHSKLIHNDNYKAFVRTRFNNETNANRATLVMQFLRRNEQLIV